MLRGGQRRSHGGSPVAFDVGMSQNRRKPWLFMIFARGGWQTTDGRRHNFGRTHVNLFTLLDLAALWGHLDDFGADP